MLKRISFTKLQKNLSKIYKYQFSTAAEPVVKRNDTFRTYENNPVNHTIDHEAKFYSISPEIKKKLFLHGGLPKSFEVHVNTFTETCLMVRQPALDVISNMSKLDYSKPTVKFVLYGKRGTGKTLSLAHIMHYAHDAGYLLIHVPWVGSWMRRCKEYCNSISKEGYIDLPLDAAAWLIHFKTQNQASLTDKNLVISQDYNWSKREATHKGAHLLELIDHGINRVKYASDCVVVLADEIKKLSNEGKCKTLVAIDGYNAFFYPDIRVYTEKKEPVPPNKVVLTEAFLNLTKHDWCNSVCVLTVDELAVPEEAQKSHLPVHLLGKEGFEHIDPFIPIYVPSYSKKELTSVLDYFRERRWIQLKETYDEELGLISYNNPYQLMLTCAPL